MHRAAVLKITLVVLFALVISAAVVGWHGNKGVSNEMDEVVDNLLLAVNYLHTKGVTITGTLLNLSDALVHIAPSTSKDLKRCLSHMIRAPSMLHSCSDTSVRQV